MASISSVVTVLEIGEAAPGIDCSVAALPASARVHVCARGAMPIDKQATAVANANTRRDDRNGSRGRHEASGTPDGTAGEADYPDKGDDAREDEEAFRSLLMPMQRGAAYDVLYAVFLILTSLECHPGTQRQGCRERQG